MVSSFSSEPADRPANPTNQPPGWRDLLPVCVRQLTDRPTGRGLLPVCVRQLTDRPRSPMSFVFDRNGRGGGVCAVSFVSRLVPGLTDRPHWFAPPLLLWSGSLRFGVGCCWCSYFRNCRPTYPATHPGTDIRTPSCPCSPKDRPTYLPHAVRVSCVWFLFLDRVGFTFRPARVGGVLVCLVSLVWALT